MTIALASALNKLPTTTQIRLYRGDTVPRTKLKEWKEGSAFVSQKFMSWSTDFDTAKEFANPSSTTDTGSQAVLFVVDAKRATAIHTLSFNEDEEEYLHLPGQGFRAVKVDEKTYPGLAVVYLQEVNRVNNTWRSE